MVSEVVADAEELELDDEMEKPGDRSRKRRKKAKKGDSSCLSKIANLHKTNEMLKREDHGLKRESTTWENQFRDLKIRSQEDELRTGNLIL